MGRELIAADRDSLVARANVIKGEDDLQNINPGLDVTTRPRCSSERKTRLEPADAGMGLWPFAPIRYPRFPDGKLEYHVGIKRSI